MRFAAVIALAGVAGTACAKGRVAGGSSYPSPTTLDIARGDLPAPGLCRVIGAAQRQRSCEQIANVAPAGSRVVYRMKDPSWVVVMCYMHPALQGYVYGIDVFNANNQRLLDVLMRADDPPVRGDCDVVVSGRPIQGVPRAR